MLRYIKKGENIGIAKQVQGQMVSAYTHPKYKNLYRFYYSGEYWVCSKYAFKSLRL